MKLSELPKEILDRDVIIMPRPLRVDKAGRSYIGLPHAEREIVFIAVELRPGDKGLFEEMQ